METQLPDMTDPNAFSLETVKKNAFASLQASCALQNDNMKTIYLGAFNNWKMGVDAGRISNANPPQPPFGFVVRTDGEGWPFMDTSSIRICDMPPIPADHSKTQAQLDAEMGEGHISIGKHLDANYWAANIDDTCKAGFKTPPLPAGPDWPDGAIFQKVGFFMGKGWWLKVN